MAKKKKASTPLPQATSRVQSTTAVVSDGISNLSAAGVQPNSINEDEELVIQKPNLTLFIGVLGLYHDVMLRSFVASLRMLDWISTVNPMEQ